MNDAEANKFFVGRHQSAHGSTVSSAYKLSDDGLRFFADIGNIIIVSNIYCNKSFTQE